MKILFVLIFLIFSSAAAQERPSESQVPARQQEPIRAEVNLITLRFAVRTSQGGFVNDLEQNRFGILENGAPRDIRFFEPPRNRAGRVGRLWLSFLLDVSGSTFATRSEEIIAAQTFLDNVHDFTQVGVFGFTDKLIPFQDFTSSRTDALKAFNAARQHLGRTAIYDSIESLISRKSMKNAAEDRKVIIVVSDGIDNVAPKVGSRADKTVALARSNNVAIYTVLVPSAAQLYIGPDPEPGGRGANGDQDKKESAFARLSTETGGKHYSGIEAILDFDQTLALINDDIFGNLYSIGYYTDDPYQEKHERDIRVQVNYPGAQVSSLFKNLPQRLYAKKRFIAALFDNEALSRLPENLHASYHEIGAEMDLLVPRREGGEIGIPFRIKISPYTLRGNEREGVRTQFGIIGILLDQEGNEVVRLREFFRVTLTTREMREGRGIIYNNKLMAPPGVYDLKVALIEVGTWKMTAFENVVRVTE